MNILEASMAALEAPQFADKDVVYIRSARNPDLFVCIPRPEPDGESCGGIDSRFRDGKRCVPGLFSTIMLFALDWEVSKTLPGILSPDEIEPMTSE